MIDCSGARANMAPKTNGLPESASYITTIPGHYMRVYATQFPWGWWLGVSGSHLKIMPLPKKLWAGPFQVSHCGAYMLDAGHVRPL